MFTCKIATGQLAQDMRDKLTTPNKLGLRSERQIQFICEEKRLFLTPSESRMWKIAGIPRRLNEKFMYINRADSSVSDFYIPVFK